MGVEEKICHFYYDVVNQLQKDFKLGSLFLEQASTSMIFGREFGDSSLSSKEAYEMIFLSHLSFRASAYTHRVFSLRSTTGLFRRLYRF